ncbi:TonB-dependent receptor [bacterium]|nr:TonB-dependent receptor [bacterium]
MSFRTLPADPIPRPASRRFCIRAAALVLCIFLFIPSRLSAGTSGILEGSVRDAETGVPLPGVNVLVEGTPLGAVTDVSGRFRIPDVPPGDATVRFRIVGYRILRVTGVTVRPDLRTRLDGTALEPAAILMDPVEVKAEPPAIQKDITGSAVRVSEDRFDRMPVGAFLDVLPTLPGVTGSGHVRGGRENEVLVLMNGLPLRDMMSGETGIRVPRAAVGQMEIQTGGFESEYGNALSGVVNVITRSGANRFDAAASGETDHFRGITQKDRASRLEASAGGPVVRDRFHYFAAAELNRSGTRWWQDFRNFFSGPVSKDASGFIRLDGRISPALRVSGQALASTRAWRDYEFSWRYNLDGLPPRNRDAAWAALLFSLVLSKNTVLNLDFNYCRMRSRIGSGAWIADAAPYGYDFFLQYVISGGRAWRADDRQEIGIVRGTATSQINDHSLVKTGFELRFHGIRGDWSKSEPQTTYYGRPLPDRPPLDFSTRYSTAPVSGSLFLQNRYELTREGGLISAGVRWDFLDPRADRPMVEWIPVKPDEYEGRVSRRMPASFKSVVSPRAGFTAPLSPRLQLFSNLGWYAQFPAFHYLYAGLDNRTLRNGMSVIKGNPDLKPETNQVWEAGLKWSVPPAGVLSLTVFSKQSRNQVDTRTFIPTNSRVLGDYGFAEYVNNDRTEASGIEISLSRERGRRVNGNVSYTYMTAEGIGGSEDSGIQYHEWGLPPATRLYPLSWDQRHTFKAGLDLTPGYGLEAGVFAEFHSPLPYTRYPSADGFTPDDPDRPFVPNNRRMRSWRMLNVKASWTVRTGVRLPSAVVFYADGRNVFNERNIVWMDASGRVGGELDDPSGFCAPRRVRAGLKVEFK